MDTEYQLLAAYQTLPDFVKALWVVVPPMFVIALLVVTLWYREQRRRTKLANSATLVYTIMPDETGTLRVYAHDAIGRMLTQIPAPAQLPLPQSCRPVHSMQEPK